MRFAISTDSPRSVAGARGRFSLVLAALGATTLLGCLAPGAPASTRAKATAQLQQRAARTLAALPLLFEANVGQTDSRVKFLTRGPGYAAFLTADETVLSLRPAVAPAQKKTGRGQPAAPQLSQGSANRPPTVLRTRLVGANPNLRSVGEKPLPAKTTYLQGNNPARWRAATQYQRVRARDVYPGIDLVHYGSQGGKLEYDFVVKPGADPQAIRLAVSGAEAVRIDGRTGDLVLRTDRGEVRQEKPVVYQERAGKRVPVRGSFVLARTGAEVSFDVGAYNRTRPLIIDPTLIYSTYLGGGHSEEGWSVATDGDGIVYVTGYTESLDFPVMGRYQGDPDDRNWDAFLAKLDTTQSGAASLLFSTYLGGDGRDYGESVAVERNGVVYIAGSTDSTDFPVKGQYQGNQPTSDGFLMKLDTTQVGITSLRYSTYLGGNGADNATSVAAEGNGIIYVGGATNSRNFPVQGQYQSDPGGNPSNAFLTKLDTTRSGMASLRYSTYLGGGGSDAVESVAAEGNGIVYVGGTTSSTNFPVLSEYQGFQAVSDGFLTKLDTKQSGVASLRYSTFLGGDNSDHVWSIATEGNGIVYVAGFTHSGNYPVQGQYQRYQGGYDGFVTQLDTTQSGVASVLFSTYLGGEADDVARSVAVEGNGIVYLAGRTASTDFPVQGQFQGDQPRDDAFLAVLDTKQTGIPSLLYSTYLGGRGNDGAEAMVADRSGGLYVVGYTASSVNFPVFHQYEEFQGGTDAFVTVFRTLAGALAVGPRQINFGKVKVKKKKTATILLRNISATERLRVTVTPPALPFGLPSLPGTLTLAPGDTTRVSVSFSPTRKKSYNSKLRLKSSDPAHTAVTIKLRGAGK